MESNEWLSCRDCGPELKKQRFPIRKRLCQQCCHKPEGGEVRWMYSENNAFAILLHFMEVGYTWKMKLKK